MQNSAIRPPLGVGSGASIAVVGEPVAVGGFTSWAAAAGLFPSGPRGAAAADRFASVAGPVVTGEAVKADWLGRRIKLFVPTTPLIGARWCPVALLADAVLLASVYAPSPAFAGRFVTEELYGVLG